MSKLFLSIVAGLGGMFGWGTADYFANQSSEKIGSFKTFFWSQVVGLAILVAANFILPVNFSVSLLLLGLGIFSGISYAVGYLLFYRGFQVGNVSVVSAVINLQTVFIMLTGVFIFGERFDGIQLPAMIAVILGVLLVSINFNDFKAGKISILKGAKEAFLASIMFGLFTWSVGNYVLKSVDWPIAALIMKVSAIAGVSVIAYLMKEKIKIEKLNTKGWIVLFLIGVLDVVGLISFNIGLSEGYSIIVAPVSSALTLVTVGLSVIFLKEKLKLNQIIGIVIVVGGIVATSI